MKIYLGTDHAGYALKEQVKEYLLAQHFDVEDCGAHTFEKGDDYPDFVVIAAKKVAAHPGSFGIVFGYSGAGENIVANKVPGVRAMIGFRLENVKLARLHNDANVLSLGSDFVTFDEAIDMVLMFLTTEFSNEERHVRRIAKIKKLEEAV